jgi:hypothetical protein
MFAGEWTGPSIRPTTSRSRSLLFAKRVVAPPNRRRTVTIGTYGAYFPLSGFGTSRTTCRAGLPVTPNDRIPLVLGESLRRHVTVTVGACASSPMPFLPMQCVLRANAWRPPGARSRARPWCAASALATTPRKGSTFGPTRLKGMVALVSRETSRRSAVRRESPRQCQGPEASYAQCG